VSLGQDGKTVEALATTFEDALAYENLELFKKLDGGALAQDFGKATRECTTIDQLSLALWDALKTGSKAEFALDILATEEIAANLIVPIYIREGLVWLQNQLARAKPVVPPAVSVAAPAPAKP